MVSSASSGTLHIGTDDQTFIYIIFFNKKNKTSGIYSRRTGKNSINPVL